MNEYRTASSLRDPALLEARLSARLCAALSERTASLPAGVDERLRFSREQALERARAARSTQSIGITGGGVGILGRLDAWWPRLGALLPIMVLAVGSLLLVDLQEREDVAVAVQIDSALLADDLPPEAYADPGFVAFLKLRQP